MLEQAFLYGVVSFGIGLYLLLNTYHTKNTAVLYMIIL